MAESFRINVSLDDAHAAKLRRRAEEAHLKEGTLARSLLSTVLDQLDESEVGRGSVGPTVVELLDAIPGAFERAELGRAQAEAGEATPLSDW